MLIAADFENIFFQVILIYTSERDWTGLDTNYLQSQLPYGPIGPYLVGVNIKFRKLCTICGYNFEPKFIVNILNNGNPFI